MATDVNYVMREKDKKIRTKRKSVRRLNIDYSST
jgi:hypothetical protein